MPNIPIYIDDSYWRKGEEYDRSAISFLDQCLMDNKALFNIHFNNIEEDIDKDLESTMSGIVGTPVSPIIELIHKLRNGDGKGGLTINKDVYDKSFFTRLPINEYRGTIIFSKNDSLVSLEKEYGYGVICGVSFDEHKIVTIEKGTQISEREVASDIKHCNSIIIVDRFALKDVWTIEKNLLPILKSIKSNTPVNHITILSQFNPKADMQPITIEKAYSSIVKVCPPSDKWQVEIYDVGEQYHDRFIITNNNYVTIGGGFDYRKLIDLKIVGTKTTTMHKYTYPMFQKEISREVKFYMRAIKNTIKNNNLKKKSNIANGASNYLIANWI